MRDNGSANEDLEANLVLQLWTFLTGVKKLVKIDGSSCLWNLYMKTEVISFYYVKEFYNF